MKLINTLLFTCLVFLQLLAQDMSELLSDQLIITDVTQDNSSALDPFSLQLRYTFPMSMGSSDDWLMTTVDEPGIGRSLSIGEFRFDGGANLPINLPEALYIRSFDDFGYRIGVGTNTPTATLDVIANDAMAPGISSVHGYAAGASVDIPAFYGENTVDDNFGIGVQGVGAWVGVSGTAAGTDSNYGVFGQVNQNPNMTNLAGFFDGDVTVTGTFNNPSDEKLKTDIMSLADNGKKSGIRTLDKIAQLNPKSYVYAEKYKKVMNLPSNKQNGFIAQELQAIFPELVKNNVYRSPSKKDEKVEFLGVDYMGLIPILTAGIQELSAENDELKQRLSKLENQLVQVLSKID